ncbi:hypothetical protein [Halodesulfovibrio marinisediminis]|uniref:Uncharacterized protein n=1 Tax=Halodesulfovibrio marinisediminis DSM 17456 TaxID=1121457 RepID=A0A1N6E9J6_9BACT|nr:hypothetical protein [Halodesulfovibrio marinisediminis]SIN79597.1 hypothetical protein SAMN02745161_0807 [Halodesulfovibrio marinisediminis DSM 17456]
MTHEELQHEIEYLRTQLAICESKKSATEKASLSPKASEASEYEQKQKAMGKEKSQLLEAEEIVQAVADVAVTAGREIRKANPVTLVATFALGFLIGRVFSK